MDVKKKWWHWANQEGGLGAYKSYTPQYVGFSTPQSGGTVRYSIGGDMMHLMVYPTLNGTSNATNFKIYLPLGNGKVAKNKFAFKPAAAINGGVATPDIQGQTNDSSKTLDFYINATGGSWTASGNKRVAFETFLEIQNGIDLLSVPVRYSGNPVIATPANFKNTCPSGMVQDPTDASKFLFYRGEFQIGSGSVGARIRVMQGSHSNYYSVPTDLGLCLQGAESYDVNGARFGQVLTVGSEIWFYYVGIDASYKWRICLAKSTDGRTFTKQGVVMDYNNTDEKSLSGPAIFIEGNTWHMYYTAWDGVTANPVNNPGASKLGIKYASSTDGLSWVKSGTYVIPIGSVSSYDDTNVEDCQIYKFNDKYVVLYNAKGGGLDWNIGLASGTDITQVLTKNSSTYFSGSGSGWDGQAVSTLYLNPWDRTIGYYQGWDTGVTDIPIGIAAVPIF